MGKSFLINKQLYATEGFRFSAEHERYKAWKQLH